jgi:LPS export ABC transporter protein LptC
MNHREIERWYRLQNLMKACQVLVVAAVVLMVVWYAAAWYFSDDSGKKFVSSGPNDGKMTIRHFSYSAPGAHPWELQAESAVVSESLDQVSLSQPKVVYKGGAGGEIFLKSQTGEFDRKTQNVTARGDVRIQLRDFHFSTDEVHYRHDTLIAQTDSPVLLEGNDLRVSGKGLKVSVETEETTIEEDVKIEIFNVRLVGLNGRLPM